MNLYGILSFWGKADIAIFLIRDGQTVFWIENEYGRGHFYFFRNRTFQLKR